MLFNFRANLDTMSVTQSVNTMKMLTMQKNARLTYAEWIHISCDAVSNILKEHAIC